MATRRKQLWLEGGQQCCWCKRPLTSWRDSTIEHFIPRSAGGRNAAGNLGCACPKCNSAKGSVSCYPETYPIIFSPRYSMLYNPLLPPATKQIVRLHRVAAVKPKKVRRKQRGGGGLGCKPNHILHVA